MKPFKGMIMFLPIILWANPVMTGVINEFQTDTCLGQKIELHVPWPSGDIPLSGTSVTTAGGTATIDTAIIWPSGGYAAIDRTVLSGPFFLDPDTGSLSVYLNEYFGDMVFYPDTPLIPVPHPNASVARYVFFAYPSSNPIFDWYLDYSPTIGSVNDDYPGCQISGFIYHNGNPAQGARIIADCFDSILNPYPYSTICTTFSQSDGSYRFDSLVPAQYLIEATLLPYGSNGQATPILHASRPVENFNFWFYGINEKGRQENGNFSILPNPFRNVTHISQGLSGQGVEILIYNLYGQLVKTMKVRDDAVWRGDDDAGRQLPAGVYFCRLKTPGYSAIQKIVKLQ
jgi:hypothetical protein